MKTLLLPFALFALISIHAQQTTETMQVGALTRTYIRYLPTGFQASENLPVVFVCHGLGANALNMVGTGFNLIADTARFIVYYPEGELNNWNQSSWNNGTLLGANVDDISFFNQMMDEAILNYNADPSRIYITGFSMGGIMSHHLACALNERIAAIGAMSGTMANSDVNNCVPTYLTPVIHLHGDMDGTVPYNSGALPSLSLVPQTIDFWIDVHSCDGTYDSIRMPDTAPGDNITVDRFVFQNCSSSDPLELWRLNNADHQFLYQPVNDITESFEVWRFFLRFSHPDPAPALLNEIELSTGVYPNPCTDQLFIRNGVADTGIFVFDLAGNTVQVSVSDFGQLKVLRTSELSPGIYLLRNGSQTIRFVKK